MLARNDLKNFLCVLSAGADVHAEDKDGFTALMMASQKNNRDIVDQSIEQGADPVKFEVKPDLATENGNVFYKVNFIIRKRKKNKRTQHNFKLSWSQWPEFITSLSTSSESKIRKSWVQKLKHIVDVHLQPGRWNLWPDLTDRANRINLALQDCIRLTGLHFINGMIRAAEDQHAASTEEATAILVRR